MLDASVSSLGRETEVARLRLASCHGDASPSPAPYPRLALARAGTARDSRRALGRDPPCGDDRPGRSTPSAASTATLARRDGFMARPNTQCTHAPATMANGKRRMAQDAHPGRNAPDSTPPRITAESMQVPRCSSSRLASSAPASGREVSSAGSDAACSTTFHMASTVSRSAVIGSRWDSATRSSDRSCLSRCRGRRDLFIASRCPRARVRRRPAVAARRRTSSAPESTRTRRRVPGRSARSATPARASAHRRTRASACH